MLTNAAGNLASANLTLIADYAALVSDAVVRRHIYAQVEREYRRTSRMLDLIFGGRPLAKLRPRRQCTWELPDAALNDPHPACECRTDRATQAIPLVRDHQPE